MVDKRLFVQRELRFSDARILEWMCRRHILSQGCSGNSRRENCAVLPEKLFPLPWYLKAGSRRCFETWAMAHWGFLEADCCCSFIRYHEGEYTIEFTTFGNLDAPWFTLLSERLAHDIPGAAFSVESHGDDGLGRGNVCLYQNGGRTEQETWEKEFEQFSLEIILPGKINLSFSQWNMALIHRIGGSRRNAESVGHWKIGTLQSPYDVPGREGAGFSMCRDALYHFMWKYYPGGAEGLLVDGWPVLTPSGKIDMENLEYALTWNRDCIQGITDMNYNI